MQVKIDSETCVGCGLCTNTCPEVFEMQDDKAIPKSKNVPKEQENCVKQAVEDCPVEAISLE